MRPFYDGGGNPLAGRSATVAREALSSPATGAHKAVLVEVFAVE